MNFRAILLSAVAAITPIAPVAVSAIALSACTTAVTPSSIATDINLVAAGLAPVVAAMSTLPNVPAAIVAQAKTYLALIQADAAQVAAATAAPSASTVQEIVQTVQALAAIAGTIPGLAPYAIIIQAAMALLPVILQDIGVTTAAAAPGAMNPVAARAILTMVGRK